MRKTGAFGYNEDAEKFVLSLITYHPQNTSTITKLAKEKYRKINYYTTKRLLKKLNEKGDIRCQQIGQIVVWMK